MSAHRCQAWRGCLDSHTEVDVQGAAVVRAAAPLQRLGAGCLRCKGHPRRRHRAWGARPTSRPLLLLCEPWPGGGPSLRLNCCVLQTLAMPHAMHRRRPRRARSDKPALDHDLLQRGAHLRRRLDDRDAGGLQRRDLVGRGALAAGDDRARVAHSPAGRRGEPCRARSLSAGGRRRRRAGAHGGGRAPAMKDTTGLLVPDDLMKSAASSSAVPPISPIMMMPSVCAHARGREAGRAAPARGRASAQGRGAPAGP